MKSIFTAIVLSLITSFCMAEAVSVGRAEIKLPGDNWQNFPIAEEVTPFGGDRAGQIKSERKVFVKKSSSHAVEAIALISGSPGGLAPLENCSTHPNVQAINIGIATAIRASTDPLQSAGVCSRADRSRKET